MMPGNKKLCHFKLKLVNICFGYKKIIRHNVYVTDYLNDITIIIADYFTSTIKNFRYSVFSNPHTMG